MDILFNMTLSTGKPVTLNQIIDYRLKNKDNNFLFFYEDYIVFISFNTIWTHYTTSNELKQIKLYYYYEMNKNALNKKF